MQRFAVPVTMIHRTMYEDGVWFVVRHGGERIGPYPTKSEADRITAKLNSELPVDLHPLRTGVNAP